MRALLQRVTRAEVRAGDEIVGAIGRGLVVFLGVGPADDDAAADGLAQTVAELRIFADEEGRTNRSLLDVGGNALVVSQSRSSRRPAAGDDRGSRAPRQVTLQSGSTCASRPRSTSWACRCRPADWVCMAVELVNDGPFTIWLDTAER